MKLDPSPKRSYAQRDRTQPHPIARFGTLLFHALTNLDSRRRIGFAVMFGMAIFLLLPDAMHLDSRILAAWIAGVVCFLGIVMMMMSHSDQARTCYRAQRQEAQHWTIFALVVCMALTSIFAIALMLSDNNKDTPAIVVNVQIVLSVAAILSSWFLTHTMFTLHYATCYYREDSFPYDPDNLDQEQHNIGGISLPEEEQPDYLDFMYFAFTIGMTSQTSDISITTRPMRRLAIGHGLVSFFFYSIIIAFSVGAVGGLL